MSRLSIVVWLSFGCCIALAIGGGLRAYATGYRLYAVQTNSMEPTIQAGDVVLVRPAKHIAVGDVISYRDSSNSALIVSHRVSQVTGDNVTTRGDAIPIADPIIRRDQIVGRVALLLPDLGVWLGRIRTPLGIVLTCGIPALCIVGQEYRHLILKVGHTKYTLRYKS